MIGALTRWYWARNSRHNGQAAVSQALERFRLLEPAARRLELGRRLQAQVRHFGDLPGAFPEWKDLAREEDPGVVLDAWHRLPILGKAEQRARFPLESVQARLGGKGILNSTGGSTGEPAFFVHDPAMTACGLALQNHYWQRMGWRPGLPLLSIWGAQRDIGAALSGLPAMKKRLSDYLYGFHVVAGFAINEATAMAALDWLEANGPAVVYGFTSLLDFTARVALERGRRLPKSTVVAAWNGAECLFPDQAERFEAVFGVPILNYYAGRELGALGCQVVPGGPLEIPRPFIHLELVDGEGKPVPPGVDGRIIVTSTVGRGTPFLRYEVGDMASFSAEHQDEAGLWALGALNGRISSLLEVGGRTISNLYWNHLFKDFPEVKQFQVVARQAPGLVFRLRGTGFEPAREAQLRSVLGAFLGPVPLEFQWMDQIPLTRAGKLLQVVQE